MYWAAMNVQIAPLALNAPRTKRFEAIIDSGATRCIFHDAIAAHLGIDVRTGTREITSGIGGQVELWLHPIKLHIPGGAVNITAGFREGLPVAGLLGMSGFFEHFHVTFDLATKQCVLDRIHYA
jgi:predicted aspartyl protease